MFKGPSCLSSRSKSFCIYTHACICLFFIPLFYLPRSNLTLLPFELYLSLKPLIFSHTGHTTNGRTYDLAVTHLPKFQGALKKYEGIISLRGLHIKSAAKHVYRPTSVLFVFRSQISWACTAHDGTAATTYSNSSTYIECVRPNLLSPERQHTTSDSSPDAAP